MKHDLHIHSKYSSDGILEPERIVKIAIKRGLNGIAVTDHNTIKGRLISLIGNSKTHSKSLILILSFSSISSTK